jgi:hypothetical protein
MDDEYEGWEDLEIRGPCMKAWQQRGKQAEESAETPTRLLAEKVQEKPPLRSQRRPTSLWKQIIPFSEPNKTHQTPRPSKVSFLPPHPSPPTDSLTWHDSEITGHAPTDPLDDGYGINGIGFRPTPAMAYAGSRNGRSRF